MLEPKNSISNSKQRKTDQPTWKLPKFSIFLRIHKFFLQVDTESGTSIPRWEKPRTLKSKFLSFFQKFKTLHSKKLTIAAEKTQNVQNPDSKLLVDQQGEFSYKRPFCIGSLLVGILALLSESIFMFRSDKYMDYDQGLVSEFVWKAWNYAASSGCLYELSQVIFSSLNATHRRRLPSTPLPHFY
ncbi:hypothetical protein OIU74_004464 [Salix koriyanagi]|uniref:Uncharacterized protein n=1 Tax=Salix koriyanagi TaxID=2511006 RepID=A0A9Q0V1X2_9ROSI|nr:hypothetical protein OIU74_004464 [Salix koriyanagi]